MIRVGNMLMSGTNCDMGSITPDTKITYDGTLEIRGIRSLQKRGQTLSLFTTPRSSVSNIMVMNGSVTSSSSSDAPNLEILAVYMAQLITVDGIPIPVGARTLEVRNGILYVDGQVHETTAADGTVVQTPVAHSLKIAIEGNVTSPIKTSSGEVTVSGTAQDVTTTWGKVQVGGDVHGRVVTTWGHVTVEGDLLTPPHTVHGTITTKKKKNSKQVEKRTYRDEPYVVKKEKDR